MSPIQSMVAALVLIAVSQCLDPINVRGSDRDGLRDRAANMHREAAELIEHGHERKAAELAEKADALMVQANRLQDQQRDSLRLRMIELLEERLRDLRNQEVDLPELDGSEERLRDIRAEIARAKRQLHEINRRRGEPGDHESPEAAERLEHMRIAIEHLKRAGLHEEARHVARRVEESEHRLHRDHRNHGAEHGEIARALEEVRREVRRLRSQVDQLMDQRSSRVRESDRRAESRKIELDPPRRRESRRRGSGPDPSQRGVLERDRQEKGN